ncbi:winged helix-turn-helix domain-containing protein [Enterobacter bugandensis]|uniref:winged helix-turn-helix domain-containing protein n=1 Tax=Enterobacter bugandensis TaxID=881260 RepID=UPI0013D81D8B|nr:winged helix-turn-helix domain-containing protein [Enterobacter bugandensis]
MLSLLDDENNVVILSTPASRLLVELVKKNGETVTRSWVLKTVWEDHGYVGSNSNLNNYLSEIRKAFSALGVHSEVLTTIPKIGIKFEANVSPSIEGKNTTTSILEVNHTSDLSPEQKITEGNSEKLAGSRSPLKGAVLLVIVIFVLIIIYALVNYNKYNKNYSSLSISPQKRTLLFKMKNCSIFKLDGYFYQDESVIIPQVKDYINKLQLDCSKVKELYFYDSTAKSSNFVEYSFFAICEKNSGQQRNDLSCRTIVQDKEMK